ncbi:hypothetical protein ACWCP6_03355 [Streptomyces sp. NPDC002004]
MPDSSDPPDSPVYGPLSRLDRYARWAGLLAGVVAGRFFLSRDDGLGVGILYAVLAFGLSAVAGVVAGDALAAPSRGAVRTAGLAPRRVRDYLPRRMTPLLLGEAVALAALLTVAATVASPDDLGRSGRSIAATCAGMSESAGAWPGSFYGIPVLVSLAVGSAACAWALRRIALRPGPEESRHDRAHAITGAWGVLVSAPLAGASATAAGALLSLRCDGTTGSVAAWVVLVPVAGTAVLTLAWSLFTVISPRAIRR